MEICLPAYKFKLSTKEKHFCIRDFFFYYILIYCIEQVLTHRSGSAVMLALIYSEILKMLRLWSLLDFDCEIFFPHDNHGLPRGYHKQKSKESDHQHILTSLTLLEKVGCVFFLLAFISSSNMHDEIAQNWDTHMVPK